MAEAEAVRERRGWASRRAVSSKRPASINEGRGVSEVQRVSWAAVLIAADGSIEVTQRESASEAEAEGCDVHSQWSSSAVQCSAAGCSSDGDRIQAHRHRSHCWEDLPELPTRAAVRCRLVDRPQRPLPNQRDRHAPSCCVTTLLHTNVINAQTNTAQMTLSTVRVSMVRTAHGECFCRADSTQNFRLLSHRMTA